MQINYDDVISNKNALEFINNICIAMQKDCKELSIVEFRAKYIDLPTKLSKYNNISKDLMFAIETQKYHLLDIVINEKLNSEKIVKTYVLYNPSNKLYKIGKSIDVDKRKLQIKLGSGSELDIVVVIDNNVESELHRELKDCRVHGEWFRLGNSELEFIKSYVNYKLEIVST